MATQDAIERAQALGWENLGLWEAGLDYTQACEALAERLIKGLDLRGKRLLDLGCGAGAQFQTWLNAGAAHISGLEPDEQRFLSCRNRWRESGQISVTKRRASALRDLPSDARFDVILSLDSAYHFASRRDTARSAARLLQPNGRLALTDLILKRSPSSRLTTVALTRLATVFEIPAEHLVSARAYRQTLEHAGYTVERFEVVTGPVLLGFAEFVQSSARRMFGPGRLRVRDPLTRGRSATSDRFSPGQVYAGTKWRRALRFYLTAAACEFSAGFLDYVVVEARLR